MSARLFPMAVLLLASLASGACSSGGSGSGGSAPEPPPDFVENEPNDDPGTALDMGRTADVTAGGTVSATGNDGVYATGDRDLFAFTAPHHGLLRLELRVPEGSDFDLALLDGAGRRLATSRLDNRAAGASRLEILLAYVREGAAHIIEVGGYAGAAADYRLRLEIAVDARSDPVAAGTTSTRAVGDLGGARSFHAAAVLPDGRALVGGGTTEAGSPAAAFLAALSTTEAFDPVAESFSAGPSLGPGRFGLTATALPDGRILFAGGDVAGTAALYDPGSGAMTHTDLPMAEGMRVLHQAGLLPCGRVLLTGGSRIVFSLPPTSETLDTTEIFDPKDLTFRAGPSLLAPRLSHAAVVLLDGRVLVSGGVGRSDTEIVDVADGVFTSSAGPPLTTVRDDHTATVLEDGRVLLAGGQDGTGKSLDTLEILDDPGAAPAQAFRPLAAKLSDARSDHQAVRLPSGQILLLGGESDPGTGDPDRILGSVDLFEPATEAILPLPDLVTPRDDHRAIRLRDGRLLVTGGIDAADTSIRDAELYDPR